VSNRIRLGTLLAALLALTPEARGAGPAPPGAAAFIERHCVGCHNPDDRKGHLDLTALPFAAEDPDTLRRWVKVHDRVKAGEMPPGTRRRPDAADRDDFVTGLAAAIDAHERGADARDGRSPRRRLNAYEYENALRDLFGAPWLQVRSRLPEDGEAWHFNKSAEALDASHVLLARCLAAAEYAMRQVLGTQLDRPPMRTVRYYAREQKSMANFAPVQFTGAVDKKVFPLIDFTPQPDVRTRMAPATVGAADPAARDREAVGSVMSAFAPGAMYLWDNFRAPVAGRYRLRVSGYSVWVGPAPDGVDRDGRPFSRTHLPNFDDLSHGRRGEPVAVYTRNGLANRRVATFDLTPEPAVHDLGDVWLVANEQLATDPSRLYRRRGDARNPLARGDGMPGVAFRWLEVEGPLYDDPAAAPGYRLLFGDLPLRRAAVQAAAPSLQKPALTGRLARGATPKDALDGVALEVTSADPERDAERLLRAFVARAYRRPAAEDDVRPFLEVVRERLRAGVGFCDAMVAGYAGVLASPGFLFTSGVAPGRLDDHAQAERLALFLWNSAPDAELRARADRGELGRPDVLRAETDRLLDDPKARRFVDAFLDYWIDARKVEATAPSATLYGDYDMDDALRDAALAETQLFFADLVNRDLPARNLIDCDYAFLNERLAAHYGVPGVAGVALRRVPLPAGSPRGGLMTQALVLKVTANGTTTSPVLRGKWIMERLLGYEIPPPPPVPAVEPDIRGAVTIRQQLDKHRADPSCATCHRRIDPPGFALESFDVFGGWRARYRAVAEGGTPPVPGRTKEGHPFAFTYGPPVDCSGELPDGRRFADVREFKRMLHGEEKQVARNLARQLVLYATGAPVRFSDRPALDRIMDQARARDYGVRTLIHAIVQSELFLNK
jgi:mono/diheme cytochrome c family protein